MKTACASCPFRVGSALAYDADAIECLDAGDEPACHANVGLDRIFAHAPFNAPPGGACAGFERYQAFDPEYQRPAAI